MTRSACRDDLRQPSVQPAPVLWIAIRDIMRAILNPEEGRDEALHACRSFETHFRASQCAASESETMTQHGFTIAGIICSPFFQAASTAIQPTAGEAAEGEVIVEEAPEPGLADIDGFSHPFLIYVSITYPRSATSQAFPQRR
jgi:hypothetical protein